MKTKRTLIMLALAVMLTGYDRDKGLVYVNDPLAGSTTYDLSLLKLRYEQMGRQCVSIE